MHIIGLTGSFGSGCTYIAEHILEAKKGYKRLSLSDILRQEYDKADGENGTDTTRHALQDFGDTIRKEKGAGVLAEKAIEKMRDDLNGGPWVVDSVRNPAEIRALRDHSHSFFLFGIYAEKETRWERVNKGYDGDRRRFENDDSNDKGDDSLEHGQQVGRCFSEADVVLTNDNDYDAVDNEDFKELAGSVGEYADLVAHPLEKQASRRPEESLMAMAYAAGQRSSCRQRKVGAVITDQFGDVIASGYNETPGQGQSCTAKYKDCFRKKERDEFFLKLKERGLIAEGKEEELRGEFRKKFRNLDICRALHAEENAILNLARNGRSVPLEECTLYTTTYPCRLCANKIANLRFQKVVYLEPYPDQEAKVILREAGTKDEFFQGVTFSAYFRIYGEQK